MVPVMSRQAPSFSYCVRVAVSCSLGLALSEEQQVEDEDRFDAIEDVNENSS